MYLVKQINNGAIFFLSLSPIRWKNEFKKNVYVSCSCQTMAWITNDNVSTFHWCSKASHWALDDLMVLFVLYKLKKYDSDFVEQKKSYRSDNLSAQRVIRNWNTLLQNKRIGSDRSVRCFQKCISLYRVRVQR